MKFNVPFVLMRNPIRSISERNIIPDVLPNEFREGIYLSSTELFSEMIKNSQIKQKEKEKIKLSLLKYWLRSCTRSTPFGVFAGSTLLTLKNHQSEIILAPTEEHTRCLRLDMNVVVEIINNTLLIKDIRDRVKYYPNNSIYETPTSYRYVEYSIISDLRKYKLVSVEKTKYLEAILLKAAKGILISDIINLLVRLEDVEEFQAKEFVETLINSQILYSELEPAITGTNPFTVFVEYLRSINIENNIIKNILNIERVLDLPYGGIMHLNELQRLINNIGFDLKTGKNLFQVDLFMATKRNILNSDLVNKIVNQANDLKSLSREYQNEDLENFINKFILKYDKAEVQLNIALDAEIGIGYGDTDSQIGENKLVDDLPTYISPLYDKTRYDHINRMVSKKYLDFLANPRDNILLKEEDLKQLQENTKWHQFPNSMFLLGSLIKTGNNDELNDFTFDLVTYTGPSAGNLLGRFTQGNNILYNNTIKLLDDEEMQNSECIYAEIVHLPQARTGNVILRPILRKYEIPYVGISGISKDKQIPISDIMVSIKNGKVFLRSRIHNKQIITRLTSAHNFTNQSLPLYKFLGDLQFQGLASPNLWDWGIFSDLKYLPRVCYKNLIIKKAQWKIEEKQFKIILHESLDKQIKDFRKNNNIPTLVVFIENDNELLIDFENTSGINLFLHLLSKYKVLIVNEFLFNEENCYVKDMSNAAFCNQLVIPVCYNEDKLSIATSNSLNTTVKRSFLPGSEWNYYKLYCGSNTADKLLTQCIYPFVKKSFENLLFIKFHFLRYRDEFPHLRVRFYNTDLEKQQQLNTLFLIEVEKLLLAGLITKLTIDTYERELERYDPNLIDMVEGLFYNDSIACLAFLDLLDDSDEGNNFRMLFSLRGIDFILNDFGFEITEKHSILKILQQSFFSEFGSSPALQKKLNSKYRQYQQLIFSHLSQENDESNNILEAIQVFKNRSLANKPIIDAINRKVTENNIQTNDLIMSLIHMFMNRMFVTKNRKIELVIYHFLEKFYLSQIALSKNNYGEIVK